LAALRNFAPSATARKRRFRARFLALELDECSSHVQRFSAAPATGGARE